MASIVPTLASAVLQIGTTAGAQYLAKNVLGASSQRREQEMALRQLQDRQNLQMQQLAANNQLERERIAAQASADEDSRRAALRRAAARQRALFGSGGVGANAADGSSQAVLLGMFQETEGELNRRAQLDNLRGRALDLGESGQSGLNVLQRTQLQEKQKLDRQMALVDGVTGWFL